MVFDINPTMSIGYKDLLQGMKGPLTRARAIRVKEALQGLVMEVQTKEDSTGLVSNPRWVMFLQLDEDLSPT